MDLKELISLSIYELRDLGREIGVKSPTSLKRNDLIQEIFAISSGKKPASPVTNRGRPPKRTFPVSYRQAVVENIPNDPQKLPYEYIPRPLAGATEKCCGYFTLQNGRGYLMNEQGSTVYVRSRFIKALNLRVGDWIKGIARKINLDDNFYFLTVVENINDKPANNLCHRLDFEKLTPCYPKEYFQFYSAKSPLISAIYSNAAIGMGARSAVLPPPKTHYLGFLCELAIVMAVAAPSSKIFMLLLGETPENIAEARRLIQNAPVRMMCTDCGTPYEKHVETANIMIDHLKREVELGRDAVLIMDSLSRLTEYYFRISQPKPQPDLQTIQYVDWIFRHAENTENAGSSTLIFTVEPVTDPLSESVLAHALRAANNVITLENCNDSLILDPARSYTLHPEPLKLT